MRCVACGPIASRSTAMPTCPGSSPGSGASPSCDLPQGEDKRALYELGRERLEREGYREIGLDHFALETDALWQALRSGSLHRNFMGYTTAFTRPLIGLGVSAIGDAGDAFAQNEKDLQRYQERVQRGRAADPSRSPARRRGPGAAPPHPAPDDAARDALGRAGRLHRLSGSSAVGGSPSPQADGLVELLDPAAAA